MIECLKPRRPRLSGDPPRREGQGCEKRAIARGRISSERRVVTLDEILDEWEQRREDDLARDIFGDDDEVGYYDDNKPNSANAICPEAFDSCWDRNS
jgi:hypothetical protein